MILCATSKVIRSKGKILKKLFYTHFIKLAHFVSFLRRFSPSNLFLAFIIEKISAKRDVFATFIPTPIFFSELYHILFKQLLENKISRIQFSKMLIQEGKIIETPL